MAAEKLFRKIIKPEIWNQKIRVLKLVGKASNVNLLLYFWIF